MRRQYLLAALTFIALLAAAPSWNYTTCDRTTPLPAGWADAPLAAGDTPAQAGLGYGVGRLPGIVGIP